MLTTRAITANRRNDHDFGETRSGQSLIFGKTTAQDSQQIIIAGFQSQTRTTPITTNPKINITGTTESTPPTEVTEISIATSSFVKPGNILPLQMEQKQLEATLMFLLIQR